MSTEEEKLNLLPVAFFVHPRLALQGEGGLPRQVANLFRLELA